ncbi:MAG: hypothetical protein ACRDN9_07110 [Streptosporangiaceae bacterium]
MAPGEEPRTVQEALFSPDRLLTLRTRVSAAYKGLYILLLKEGAIDWRTGDAVTAITYFEDAIDIHHIFPRSWCQKSDIDPKTYNSIINKTPLSARTNRVIGGWAPSDYRSRLANSAGVDRKTIDKHVGPHCIDTARLWSDDFDGFVRARQRALLNLVASAMGKPVASEVTSVGAESFDVDDAIGA